jgi:hypothetical protein
VGTIVSREVAVRAGKCHRGSGVSWLGNSR